MAHTITFQCDLCHATVTTAVMRAPFFLIGGERFQRVINPGLSSVNMPVCCFWCATLIKEAYEAWERDDE